MTIRMQHPEHGWHEATPSEMETMKTNGWQECETEIPALLKKSIPEPIAPVFQPETTLHLPVKRKAGRPSKVAKPDEHSRNPD